MSSNRPEYDDEIVVRFAVWSEEGAEADARTYCDASPKIAAERCARDDFRLAPRIVDER